MQEKFSGFRRLTANFGVGCLAHLSLDAYRADIDETHFLQTQTFYGADNHSSLYIWGNPKLVVTGTSVSGTCIVEARITVRPLWVSQQFFTQHFQLPANYLSQPDATDPNHNWYYLEPINRASH